jgi:hypothetical protein
MAFDQNRTTVRGGAKRATRISRIWTLPEKELIMYGIHRGQRVSDESIAKHLQLTVDGLRARRQDFLREKQGKIGLGSGKKPTPQDPNVPNV